MDDLVKGLRGELINCDCAAASDYECGCVNGNWPERYCKQAADELERLHRVCRDAYEVWAGSEGIPEPETAAEAYLYQLLINMRDEVKKGL